MGRRRQDNFGLIALVAIIAFAFGKCSGDKERPSTSYAEPATLFSDTPTISHSPSRAHGGSAFANCSEARAAGAAPVYIGEPGYAHRRKVKWLWVDRDGVSVSEIYRRKFSMRTIYLLARAELNVPALERYMNSQRRDPSAATSTPDPFVLIIDEINRANISKVFGELITLLEPDKRIGQPNEIKLRLPYSGDEFGVPSNLHIIGTMNTADRSIALLDTALRRRFEFAEMMPDPDLLADAAQLCGVDLPRLLRTLNERIEYLFDREHQVGHAYFISCQSRADLDERMRKRVIPLLTEYFYEDWAKVAAILGDHDGTRILKREELRAPAGLDEDADMPPRWRWSVRHGFGPDAYSGLL
ncbi:AAA family ATPase [Sphingopyxis sp.]|uniref:AAA family ATPase n=1 Tax=Sphingopyxis sp. TaxID=1908224 RepID=UPI00260DFAF5|nr:AAA family ATPase [Sphingopyxis sp.]MCW0197645.1 AAA family ATPase [Sphingopyxis sp.]